MTTLTIPKSLTKKGDLVVISRREYEVLLRGTLGKQGKEKDWLYQEPFVSELKRRIEISKKELKGGRIIGWKGHR